MYTANKVEDKDLLDKLPTPVGYHMLIAIPDMSETTAGGVFMPDALKKAEETASIIGYVISAGAEAYQDVSKFPSGPYCQPGDFVMFRSYSGTRFKVGEKECRLINDDSVEARVTDPRGYSRV